MAGVILLAPIEHVAAQSIFLQVFRTTQERAFHCQRQKSLHARGSAEAIACDNPVHLLPHLGFRYGSSCSEAANAIRYNPGLSLARHQNEAKRPTDHTQGSKYKKNRVHR